MQNDRYQFTIMTVLMLTVIVANVAINFPRHWFVRPRVPPDCTVVFIKEHVFGDRSTITTGDELHIFGCVDDSDLAWTQRQRIPFNGRAISPAKSDPPSMIAVQMKREEAIHLPLLQINGRTLYVYPAN